jgi:hypothetical protein
VHLSVEEAFKGITQSKITTYQGTASGDCSLVFEKGERYLFYAWYSEETKQFHTNFCTRTRPLNIAAEDLDYLRNLPASDQNSRLSGTAVRLDYFRGDSPSTPELLKGIKVTATGDDGQRFEAVTDHQGFYKIVGLPSGHYKVSAEVPAHLTLERNRRESVEIRSNGCASVDILARTNGRISGVLRDAKGQVLTDTNVELVHFELANRIGERGIGLYTKTNESGRFEFGELTPGRYLLGVNLQSAPDGDTPFRRTFFPGVRSSSTAKVLVLGVGENLTDNDFRLPPRLPVEVITGTFVWQNGEPVKKGLISLKDTPNSTGGESLDYADVDSQGRFTLKALAGTKGWVHGSVLVEVPSGLDLMVAKPIRVAANSKQKPIKLIVTQKTGGGVRILR